MTNVGELWRNIFAAGLTCGILLSFANVGSSSSFLVGFIYAGFFEYFYHRYIGHSNIFPLAAEKHRDHHRTWRGSSTDRTKKDLNEAWYFFPVALLAHFLLGILFFGFVPWTMLVAFTLFYMQFEIFHWATHIEDNWLDAVLYNIPILKSLRREHINWHLHHHERPKERFNFSPPYAGDYLFGTATDWSDE